MPETPESIAARELEIKQKQVEHEIGLASKRQQLEEIKFEQAKIEASQRHELETKKFEQATDDAKKRLEVEERERNQLSTKEIWSRVLAGIPLLVAFIAPTVGYIQFLETSKITKATEERARQADARAEQSRLEAKQLASREPLIKRRLAAYEQLLQAVGTIISKEKSTPEFTEAVAQFERLYWTKMAIVEDDKVASASALFKAELDNYLAGRYQTDISDPKAELRAKAEELSNEMRPSLQAVYDVSIALDLPAKVKDESEKKQ